MANFEETQGTVLEATIGSGQSRYSTSSGYKYRTSYFPQITYQYSVNGSQYTNNRFSHRNFLINRKGMINGILAKYPIGSNVTVYFDPQNPSESFLQKGYGSLANKIVLLVVGAVILIAVVLALLLLI